MESLYRAFLRRIMYCEDILHYIMAEAYIIYTCYVWLVPCPDWIQNYKDKVIRFVEDAITNNAYEEI